MASINFGGEAAESFANLLQHADTTGDYYGVRVRLYDDAAGGPVGEPFDVIVRELRVY